MEPIFFTKTCARDAKRVVYQIAAIRRLYPLATHVVMVERAGWADAVREAVKDNRPLIERLDFRTPPGLSSKTTTVYVEDLLPEAMEIEDAYLRQQYCKLMAPIVLGVDTIQLDSDMCPKPCGKWIDELFGSSSLPRWNLDTGPKSMEPGLERLTRGYEFLFDSATMMDGVSTRPPRWAEDDARRSFMHSQWGWYIRRDWMREFIRAITNDKFQYLPDVMRSVVAAGHLFSEYQFLGLWLWRTTQDAYDFRRGREVYPWVHHFPSTEPLSPDQEKLLREAAGIE